MLSDADFLQLVPVNPGAATFIAQIKANFGAISRFFPSAYVGVAGESLAVDDALAFDSTDGKLYKADSNGANYRWNFAGMARNAATAGQNVVYQFFGPYSFAHAILPGKPIYLGETPGLLTDVAPTTPRIVALAAPSNVILLRPSWASA